MTADGAVVEPFSAAGLAVIEPFAAAGPVSSDLDDGAAVPFEDGAAFNGGFFFCPNDSAIVG